jgi:hypothetical protein
MGMGFSEGDAEGAGRGVETRPARERESSGPLRHQSSYLFCAALVEPDISSGLGSANRPAPGTGPPTPLLRLASCFGVEAEDFLEVERFADLRVAFALEDDLLLLAISPP